MFPFFTLHTSSFFLRHFTPLSRSSATCSCSPRLVLPLYMPPLSSSSPPLLPRHSISFFLHAIFHLPPPLSPPSSPPPPPASFFRITSLPPSCSLSPFYTFLCITSFSSFLFFTFLLFLRCFPASPSFSYSLLLPLHLLFISPLSPSSLFLTFLLFLWFSPSPSPLSIPFYSFSPSSLFLPYFSPLPPPHYFLPSFYFSPFLPFPFSFYSLLLPLPLLLLFPSTPSPLLLLLPSPPPSIPFYSLIPSSFYSLLPLPFLLLFPSTPSPHLLLFFIFNLSFILH